MTAKVNRAGAHRLKNDGELWHESGFSLIEVMIAITIFAIALLGISSMQLSGIRGNSNANLLTSGVTVAMEQLETLITLPYNNAALADSDNDGTSQDVIINSSGNVGSDLIDDNGGNFGLDDNTALTADGNATSGRYTIFWNIALDMPIPETKTIHVIVEWNDGGVTKSVTLESMIANSQLL